MNHKSCKNSLQIIIIIKKKKSSPSIIEGHLYLYIIWLVFYVILFKNVNNDNYGNVKEFPS